MYILQTIPTTVYNPEVPMRIILLKQFHNIKLTQNLGEHFKALEISTYVFCIIMLCNYRIFS